MTLGESILKKYWHGLPVCPVTIAENMGIEVKGKEFPLSIAGILVKTKDAVEIWINTEYKSVERKRYFVAVALGLFCINANFKEDISFSPDIVIYNSENCKDKLLVKANRFAQDLLIPRDDLAICIADGMDINELSKRYKVTDSVVNLTGLHRQIDILKYRRIHDTIKTNIEIAIGVLFIILFISMIIIGMVTVVL